MSLSLTPQSLKRKLQQIADANRNEEEEEVDGGLEMDRNEETTLLQKSPVVFRHLSPADTLNYSTRNSHYIISPTKLQNNYNFSSMHSYSFPLTSYREILKLFSSSKRPIPFPLELLKPNLLTELFVKGRALEKYFQWRFDDLAINDSFTLKLKPLQRPFVRSSIPSVTFSSYMERLFRYCQPEPIHILAIVAYSERLRIHHRIYLPPSGWHRFVVVAWIVSSKALIGDQYWTNQYWARVSGMSVTEICLLETELIAILDWRLQISLNELAASWHLIQSLKI